MTEGKTEVFKLQRRTEFKFVLEDDQDKVYSLPSLKALSFEDGQMMTRIDAEDDITKKGGMVRDFILKYNPDLEKKGIADMEYFEIFNAYALREGKDLGESKASQRS